jgi:hypothetical protein
MAGRLHGRSSWRTFAFSIARSIAFGPTHRPRPSSQSMVAMAGASRSIFIVQFGLTEPTFG